MKWFIGLIILVVAVCLIFSSKNVERRLEPTLHENLSKFDYIDSKLLSEAIGSYMDSLHFINEFSSASLAIVENDSTVYIGGFGNRSSSSEQKVDSETVFRIGSLSKGFHGVLTAILVENGLISWNERPVDWIQDFKLQDLSFEQELNIEHLISHTGGFPYHSYTNLIEGGASLDNIGREFGQISNLKAPGIEYSYQNAAFAMSALTIENKLNTDYASLLNRYIFTPLKMKTASTSYEDITNRSNVAFPKYWTDSGWKDKPLTSKYYNAIAAGGINASILDMSKYMKLLLGNEDKVLSDTSLSRIFKPRIETKTRRKYYQRWDSFENSFYALGWRVHLMNNGIERDTIIHHGGQVNGYRSEIFVHPTKKYSICVLFSDYSLLANKIIPEVRKIFESVKTTSESEIEKPLRSEEALR